MAELNFLETDSKEIYNTVLNLLEQAIATPLNAGDERRIFGEALVMVINTMFQTINDGARQRLLRYARGEVLDALGESRGVTRITPSVAETTLRFSLESPISSNIIIPSGIRVTGPSNLFFETSQTVVLPAGLSSITAPAVSVEGGSEYNDIAIGELDTIVDKSQIPQISAVTNTTMTSGGGNTEDDYAYRERIRTAENGLSCGTEAGYRFWTLSANSKIVDAAVSTGEERIEITKSVQDGKVFVCAPNYIEGTMTSPDGDFSLLYEDDGLITITPENEELETMRLSFIRKRDGVVSVMPILAGGEVPSEDVLEDVREMLSRPEVKPLTDYVRVSAPSLVFYDVELEYWTDLLTEADTVQAVEASDGAISQYIYWQDSTAGQDINPDQLAKRVLSPSTGTGAVRVKVIKPDYVELSQTEVAKWSGNLKVSHQNRRPS